MREARGVLALAAWLLIACGSGSPGQGAPADGGGGAGGTGGAACIPGGACACGDGRVGVRACHADTESCDCSGCSPFVPGVAPAWQPCGGEPSGRWRTRSDDRSAYQLPFMGSTGTCDTQPVSETAPYDLRLELHSDGEATVTASAGESVYDVLASCLATHGISSCDEVTPSGGGTLTCADQGCGVCSCTAQGGDALVFSGTWTRSGTRLTVVSGYDVYEAEYCVAQGEMTLLDATGVLVTLVPAHEQGSALPCAQRLPSHCTAGGGCHLGSCVGGATCPSATSGADCTNRVGCTWNPGLCAGQASPCELQDYDITPGCSFVPGVAECVGTPEVCAYYQHWSCPTAPGCFCDASDPNCQLTDCKGEPTPCAALSELECTRATGCAVVITPDAAGGTSG